MMTACLAWGGRCGRWAVRALVVLAPFAAGCGGGVKPAETHVGREEAYHTGNFDYDEFFEDVVSLQTSSKSAAAEEKTARAPLGQALGIGETSVDQLLEAFRAKAEELANTKARVHLFFIGIDEQGRPLAGKKIAVTAISGARQLVPKDAAHIAAATGQTAQAEGQVWETYAPLPDKGRRLQAKAVELRSSVDTDFAQVSKDKRSQIEKELKAAEQVSAAIAVDTDKVVAQALRFLKESSEIVMAAATAESKPPASTKPGKGKGGKSQPPAEPARATKPKETSSRPARKENKEPGPSVAPKKAPAPPDVPAAEPAPKAPDFNP